MAVPAQYIKDAPVDWRLEFMQAARQPMPFGSSKIPPPSFGVWGLLELCDCDLVHPQKEPTPFGGVMAAYIAATGQSAAQFVNEYLQSDNRPTTLEDAIGCPLMSRAVEWCATVGATPDQYLRLAEWLFCAFTGFSMVPGCDGDGSGEYIFSLESLGSMVAAVGESLGVSWESIMWETPMVVVGHASAQKAKQGGTKGVNRPKDRDHMKKMFKLEKELIAAGKLLPWQEDHPLVFGPLGHESAEEYYRLAELTCAAKEKQRNG